MSCQQSVRQSQQNTSKKSFEYVAKLIFVNNTKKSEVHSKRNKEKFKSAESF
jgi:hypothetical protein